MSFLGRFLGPPDVERLKERGNVDGLIRALSYEDDAEVRQDAAQALGDLGDQRAVRPLIDALGDDKESVRQAAVTALGHLGDPRAMKPLADVLTEPTMTSRAVAALGRIGDPRALVPLLEAGVLARKKRVPFMRDRIGGAVSDILDRHGAAGLAGEPPSRGALSHPDSAIRHEAVKLLGRLRGPKVLELVSAALRDKDAEVRGLAALSLGELGKAEAVPPLVDALNDGSASVRCAAAEALGRLEASEAVEPLQGLLQDSSSTVRIAAVKALVAIGDEGAAASLRLLLDDAHGLLRRQAARALAALGWEPEDADTEVKYLAARADWDALVHVGEPAVEPLVHLLVDPGQPDRGGAALALGRIGSDAALTALVDALQGDRVGQSGATKALAATGGERVIQRLTGLVADTAAPLTGREAAAEVLGEIGGPAVEATRHLLWHQDGTTRRLAAEVLAEMGWEPR
ncbi:MAG: HEAT repeat domain-containing protein, partial [Anaerolineae bacterium]